MRSSLATQQALFLSRFDSPTRRAIIEYGKRITSVSGESDVIMFMARKSVCLAESLRLLRLASFQCPATSHRVLDMAQSWLAGKRVAVFDDALITGTTLCRTQLRLEQLGCTVRVCVFCVNKKWWSQELVTPEKPYLLLSDRDCASVCADIVDAISILPLPYATDYPFFSGIKIHNRDLHSLLSAPFWSAFDVTTNLQASHGIFSRSFEPTSESLPALWRLFGTELEPADILKVRLYGRPFHRGKGHSWCCLLPLVCLQPLTKAEVTSICEHIFSATTNADELRRWFKAPNSAGTELQNDRFKAQLRLIQYLASTRLARYWLDTLTQCSHNAYAYALDAQSVRYLFPDPIVPAISTLCEHHTRVLPKRSAAHRRTGGEQASLPFSYSSLSGADAWSIEESLIGLFLHLYKNVELPARRIAKKHGRGVFSLQGRVRREYQQYLTRLEKGYSLPDLRNTLARHEWPLSKECSVVSCFLDRMIDRGVVVPTTCVVGDMVFRGYRHGEDVQFGRAEMVALHKMLVAYSEERHVAGTLAGLEIEKLSVIAIKKLLEGKYLVRPDKNILGQSSTVGVRFSLHGAVVAEASQHLYDAPSESCIRNILADAGVLSRKSKRDSREHARYSIQPLPSDDDNAYEISLRSGTLEEADTLGSMFGYLRRRARNTSCDDKLTQEELTLVATTAEARDLCGALGAEVMIVRRGYERFHARMANSLTSASHAHELVDFLRNREDNYMFLALHSGHWKYTSWHDRAAWSIVDRVAQGLRESGHRRDANKWVQLWQTGRQDIPDSIPPTMNQVIRRLAQWLYSFRFHYTVFELAVRRVCDGGGTQGDTPLREKVVQELLDCRHMLEELGSEDGDEALQAGPVEQQGCDPQAAAAVGHDAVREMARLATHVDDLLTSVDVIASPYGEKKALQDYANALVVRLHVPEVQVQMAKHKLHSEAIEAKRRFEKQRHVNPGALGVLPSEAHDLGAAIVIVGYRQLELTCLLQYLAALLESNTIGPLSFMLFPGLTDSSLLYCDSSTNEYFGNLFWRIVKEGSATAITQGAARLDYAGELHVFLEGERDVGDVMSKTALALLNKTYRQQRKKELRFPRKSTLRKMSVTTYRPTWSFAMASDSRNVDVGIIGVVSDEFRAIVGHLEALPAFRPDVPSSLSVRKFCLGTLPASNGELHSVACIRALRQGNNAIMPAYEELRNEYNPTLIVLVGIAGALDEKLEQCDVVIGNSVIDYDSRAETANGPKHTSTPLPIMEAWVQNLLNQFEEKHGEEPRLAAVDGARGSHFGVAIGPIGSGAAVVKDEDAEIRKWLKLVSRKTHIVETEAVGVAEQYYNNTLLHNSRTAGYLIVRGIQDKADAAKDKKYRHIATAHAMRTLAELLSLASSGFTREIPRRNS